MTILHATCSHDILFHGWWFIIVVDSDDTRRSCLEFRRLRWSSHWLVAAKRLRWVRFHRFTCIQRLRRHGHALGDHVPIVLVDTVVFVSIRVDVDIVQIVVDFVFEQAPNHVLAVFGSQLLGETQQQLILVAVTAFVQFSKSVLQILHRVVPQLEQELHHVVGVLLLRGNFSGIHSQ